MKYHLILLLLFFIINFQKNPQCTLLQLNEYLTPGTVVSEKYGIFTPNELVLLMPQSNPYFSINLNFSSTLPVNPGYLEVIVFNHLVQNYVGFTYALQKYTCCEPGLIASNVCTIPNTFILYYPPGAAGYNYTYYYRVPVSSSSLTYTIIQNATTIYNSGVWYMYIANCHVNNTFTVTGTITWRNPYGHLPAQTFAYIPCYWILFMFYVILAMVWLYRFFYYCGTIITIHYVMAVSIAIATLASFWWGIAYAQYNQSGIFSIPVHIIGVLLTGFQLTAIRLLIILLALGFTITTHRLSRRTIYVILGVLVSYLTFESLYHYLSVLSEHGAPISYALYWVAFIFLALTNFVFVSGVGIFSIRTITALRHIEHVEKYTMYRNVSMILAVTFLISAVFVISELIIEASGSEDDAFRVYWLLNAYWEFIYFSILAYISTKFIPGDDPAKYSIDPHEIEMKLPKRRKKDPEKVIIHEDDDDDLFKFGVTLDPESSYTSSEDVPDVTLKEDQPKGNEKKETQVTPPPQIIQNNPLLGNPFKNHPPPSPQKTQVSPPSTNPFQNNQPEQTPPTVTPQEQGPPKVTPPKVTPPLLSNPFQNNQPDIGPPKLTPQVNEKKETQVTPPQNTIQNNEPPVETSLPISLDPEDDSDTKSQ